MKLFQGNLIEKITRTPTVVSFRFKTEDKVDFLPGQFLKVLFDPNNKGNSQLNKYLSFSSSPMKDYIEVTKRLSESDFSKKLENLNIDDAVFFQGPMGRCVFTQEYEKIGFLVGGIGITPVISVVEYIVDKNLNTDVVLFYSNRNPEETAFKEELDFWQKKKNNIKVIYIITDCAIQDSECIYGNINKDIVTEKAGDIKERSFFIFGPPKMVTAMENLCIDSGCRKEEIIIERFMGY